jgi:arylsulfatase A-like enzyme
MTHSARSFAAAFLLSACVASGRPAPDPSASRTGDRPNIVVLLADDLGIGEVGAWGQLDVKTPHIDQLARDGMKFTEFRSSAAVCGPARCSFMTGFHNGRCRLDDNDNDYLRAADTTLAERLKQTGYTTALIGKWGLSWDTQPESWPNAQGFDVFFGYRDQVHAHNFYPEYLLSNADSLKLRNVVPNARPMGSGRATVRLDYAPELMRTRALDFVRTSVAARRPFFLFWATNLPHINNEASKSPDGGYEIPTLGQYADRSWPLAKKSYAAQITRLDDDLGALRTLVDSLGVSRNTIVIFLSDNGATFLKIADDGTSNIVGRWFDGTKSYRGFKGDLFDGGLRVPGVIAWPGVVQPESQSAARLDFTDLHATIVAASGLQPSTAITGRSFLPVLTGRGTFAARPHQVWFSPDRNQSAVLEGKWKAVWFGQAMQLYDLDSDPAERTDLASRWPSVVAHLDSIRRAEDQRVTHPVKPRR